MNEDFVPLNPGSDVPADSAPFPKVTLIIATYNEEPYISGCLDALLGQSYPLDQMEFLVIDGGSTDQTRDILQGYQNLHSQIRVLENPRKCQTPAYNLGIRESSGQFVLIINAHSVCAPDYVLNCVTLLQTTDAENVGGVQRVLGTSYMACAIALAMSSPFGVGNAPFHYAHHAMYVESVFGGAWRKRTLLELGGYDEALPGNEDYELNYRLRQRGGKVLLSPRIRISYYARTSLARLWRQYAWYGYVKAWMLRRHPASLRWRQIIPPAFDVGLLVSGILVTFHSPLGFIVPACYLCVNFAASLVTAQRGGLKYLPVLPPAFAIAHVAWGLGLLAGLLRSSRAGVVLSAAPLGVKKQSLAHAGQALPAGSKPGIRSPGN